MWDTKTGETVGIYEGHKDSVMSVCVSPDMTRVSGEGEAQG